MSQIYVSLNNSTYVPLASGSKFYGSADVMTSYQEIDIIMSGSPGVAPGCLYFEFGSTSNKWEISVPLETVGPNQPPVILRAVLPFFRVRYYNGEIPLNTFRLTTVFHKTAAMRLTRFLSQPIEANEPVELVRIGKSVLPDGAASEATLLSLLTASMGVQQVTGSVTVTGITFPDSMYVTGSVSVVSPTVPHRNDVNYDTTSDSDHWYYGYAELGTAESAPAWTVKRLTLVSGSVVATRWSPGGQIWDDRGSLSYV